MPTEINPDIVRAAIKFLREFADVEVSPLDGKHFAHGNQQVLEFPVQGNRDIERTRKVLSARLGVAEDSFADHHGLQCTWDLDVFRRVTLSCRWGETPQIGFVHWD